MAFILGNGITAVFTTSSTSTPASTDFTFKVTGFSYKGGDRAQIDVTTADDARRKMLPGLASVEEVTLQIKYDSTATGGSGSLKSLVENCGLGGLVITAAPSDNCGTNATLYSFDADVMSFNFSTELDGIVEGDISFMVKAP
tara:strand:- start:853 stop:1278 length:426 start_codon:yes stop_codon:yes gene_type:complete